ncbi:hypothetical protein RI054_30g120000 [Pseudoscourfieldia marina]
MPSCHRCSTSVKDESLLATCPVCMTHFHNTVDCGRRIKEAGIDMDPLEAAKQCPKCAQLCICAGGPVKCHAGVQRKRRQENAFERMDRRQKRIQIQKEYSEKRQRLKLATGTSGSSAETLQNSSDGSPPHLSDADRARSYNTDEASGGAVMGKLNPGSPPESANSQDVLSLALADMIPPQPLQRYAQLPPMLPTTNPGSSESDGVYFSGSVLPSQHVGPYGMPPESFDVSDGGVHYYKANSGSPESDGAVNISAPAPLSAEASLHFDIEAAAAEDEYLREFKWDDMMNLNFLLGFMSSVASVICLTVLLVSVWQEPTNARRGSTSGAIDGPRQGEGDSSGGAATAPDADEKTDAVSSGGDQTIREVDGTSTTTLWLSPPPLSPESRLVASGGDAIGSSTRSGDDDITRACVISALVLICVAGIIGAVLALRRARAKRRRLNEKDEKGISGRGGTPTNKVLAENEP